MQTKLRLGGYKYKHNRYRNTNTTMAETQYIISIEIQIHREANNYLVLLKTQIDHQCIPATGRGRLLPKP